MSPVPPPGFARRPAWVAALAALALASCTVAPPAPPPFEPAAFQGFLTPAPLLPFRATGSALFNSETRTESGNLLLEATAERAYLLKLQAPVTGAVVLEVRFDAGRLLLLDYGERRFFAGGNEARTRKALFSIDIAPEEFQILLTGRLSRAEFEAAGGTFTGSHEATFSRYGATYRFNLDDHGLPKQWVKEREGAIDYLVEYRAYLALMVQGRLLRVPHRIRVYLDARRPALVLGIQEFQPGRGSAGPIAFDGPPAPGWQPIAIP